MRRVPFEMPQPAGEKILLKGREAVHLRDVLRVKSGEKIVLFTGRGAEYEARVLQADKDGLLLEVLNLREGLPASPLFLTIGIALLKDSKVDDLIRPLTELGVRRIRIYQAGRSVPSPDTGKMEKKLLRWMRLAVEAMKQCGVNDTPEIFFHKNLAELLGASLEERNGEKTKNIVFWENAQTSHWPDSEEKFFSMHALFGPEGGFTGEEIELLFRENFSPLGLGPRILRAPTAILSGTALLQYRYGDLSLPPTGFQPQCD